MMYCAFCRRRFEADDQVVVLSEDSRVVLHEGGCAEEYLLENYCEGAQSYLQYLEEEFLL